MKTISLILMGIFLVTSTSGKSESGPSSCDKRKPRLYKSLQEYIHSVEEELADIPEERKLELHALAKTVAAEMATGEPVKMTFICTHNSRRSHMGQIWAATAAKWYGMDQVQTFSGGTESTAFNPRAVAALERAGFEIKNPGGENPRYQVSMGSKIEEMGCFSKKYSHPENPQENFIAVMTCSQADEACPIVQGASHRVAIPYLDPKVADGTPQEADKYTERCRQIAREMLFLFSEVEKLN